MVEGACLESMCRGNSTVGSNPTLSAIPGLEKAGRAVGLTNEERCQSGRMGRSRKPLTVRAVRGFESHPLRHSSDETGRSHGNSWTVRGVRGFESHPLRHSSGETGRSHEDQPEEIAS